MSLAPSLTLAPHSRLRMDVRLGRLGSLRQAQVSDPQLFDRLVMIEGEQLPRRVGDLLLQDAILTCRPPANLPVVTYLATQKASTPDSLVEALGCAVSLSDVAVANRLVELGWSPDAHPTGQPSALEYAASHAQCALLRQWKAFLPGTHDAAGANLFHHLCRANLWSGGVDSALEASRILIVNGVDWHHQDKEGNRPADVCVNPGLAEGIDQMWRRHAAATRRHALGKIAAPVNSEAASRSRRM